MKITSVELHPSGSANICILSFRDPSRQNPYNVKGITGLDVEEIVPRYYGGAVGATKFYNLAQSARQITARIGLNPNFGASQSYSVLRDDLYKLIASSRTGLVQVQFKNGTTIVAVISGFVTKFEAPHFEREPEVQITLRCDDPRLMAPTPVSISVAGLDPALTHILDEASTSPHGFQFDLTFTGATAGIEITDPTDATWSFEVIPAGGFLTGDILHLSSEYNDKQIYITRGVNTIHLADKITPGSVWPLLFPGDNQFSFTNPTTFGWTEISHYPTFWGV
jgi:hypothetical protein